MPARRGSVTAVSVFVVGLIVWACCVSCLRRPFVGDEVDDGQYLVGAQSLRDGTGYRLTSRVGSPVARKYPPGVSAVTAVGLTLMPGQPSLAKDQAVARAYMLLSTIGLAVACRRLCMLCGLDGWTATLLGLAVPFHPDVVMFSH